MSCKHLMWGHYCKKRQEFCHDAFEDHEDLCVNCADYKDKNEVIDLKKIFNKGPATNTNCACGANNSTAENDYVSMLEKFINNLYPDGNWGFFGMDGISAEGCVDKNMRCLGYNTELVNKAFVDTINNFKTNFTSCILRLDSFCNNMLRKPHKDYANHYSTNFRFVLTLVLGYLRKLDSIAIIDCDDPKQYFWDMIANIKVPTVCDALNKTRAYVEASNDINLAEGMRMVEQWFKEKAKENIPPKELTIADIEKQLGYKIKIVGEDK